MNTPAIAYLAYGYDLGSANEWAVHEVDSDGYMDTPWLPKYDQQNLFEGYAMKLLREHTTVPRPAPLASGYTLLREQSRWRTSAEEATGVEFVGYGLDGQRFLLIARGVRWDSRGSVPRRVDHLMMDDQMLVWEGHLRRAISVLGITPIQSKPCWLLCAAYG